MSAMLTEGRRRFRLGAGTCALAALATASPALAQPYAVPWYKVAGGGATSSTGGTYSLGSTIGQPDAGGPLTGGTYSVAGGFWPGAIGNQPPVLAAIGNRTVAEAANLTFTVSATDADPGDILTYAASGLPAGATFNPATRTFDWTPGFTQAGTHPGVTFTVDDGHGGTDSEAITIFVTNTNQFPELFPIPNQFVAEGALLTFEVTGTDPDGEPVTSSASGLPPGATFTPATRTFSWTPTLTQSGMYTISVQVTDPGGLSDSQAVSITVRETLVSRGDFNGDALPDLVWRHDVAGQNVVWFMNGVNMVSGTFTDPAVLEDPRWKIVGTNDFNGDAQMDLLWRHAQSGENVVWFLNGVTLVSGTFTTPSALTDTRWQMVGTGDFDQDARPDILWRHDTSGENVLWYMTGTVLQSGTFLTPSSLTDVRWKMAGVADFDRDGRQDILWHHNTSGQAVLWYMNGSVLASGTFTDPPGLSDVGWHMVAVGDYNADQKPDIVWRHQVSGQNVVWFMDNATLISGTFTNPSTFADTNWKLVGPR
jgi:hypothetical protein